MLWNQLLWQPDQTPPLNLVLKENEFIIFMQFFCAVFFLILFSLTTPKKRRQRLDFLHLMPFHFFFQRKNYTKYVAEYKATPQ